MVKNSKTIDKNETNKGFIAGLTSVENGNRHEESNGLYSIILNSTQSVFYIVQDGKFQIITPQLLKLTGLSRKELLRTNPLDLVYPEDRAMVRENAIKMLKGQRSEPYEFRILDKEGNIKYTQESVISITFKGKKATLGNAVDLTGHRHMEEDLRISEQRYRHLFDNMNDAVFLADADSGIIIEANQRGAALLGRSCEEMIGMHQTQIHPPGNPEKYRQQFQKHIAHGSVSDEEGEILRKDGTIVPVAINASTFTINGQHFMVGMFQDISRRKQAEEALQESERFNSSLLTNAPNPITVINPDTSIGYVNSAFEKLTGFTSAEVIGIKSPYPWWPDEFKKEFTSLLIQDMTRDSNVMEKQLQKKNGERFWAEFNLVSVRNNGKLEYLLLNWVDITARKRIEAALRDSETKFSVAFHASPNAISISRLKDGTFLEVNDTYTRITGYTREEVIGRNAAALNMWTSNEQQDRMLQKATEHIRMRDEEYDFRTKSGNIVTMLVSSEHINLGGEPCLLVESTDITEQKRQHYQLVESESKYRSIFTSVSDIIIVLDRQGKIIDINDKVLGIAGYKKEELVGKEFGELPSIIPPKSLETIAINFKKRLEGQIVSPYEVQIRKKEGETINMEINAVPLIVDGEIAGDVAILRDITERKRMEGALRESEEKFSKAFSSSPNAVCIFTIEDSKFIEVNDSFMHFTGYGREEVIGHTPFDLDLWVNEEDPERMINEIKETGRLYNREMKSRMKSGEIRTGLFSAQNIEIGGKNCMILVITDITEEVKAKEALRESEEKASKAFRASPVMIAITRVKDGKYVDVNDNYTLRTGYSREELIGKTTIDVGVWASEGNRARMDEILQKQGRVQNEEFDFLMKSGEIRTWLFSLEPITIGGEPCLIGVSLDITERKKMENELREAMKRADAANRAKSEFLARMSHEIRTPIHGVMGTLDLLGDTELGQEQRQYVSMSKASAETLLNVINEILDFSKIEAGKLVLESKEFELHTMLEEALETVAVPAHRKGLEVILQVSDGVPGALIGDEGRLRQVLINLLGNAVKFTTQGEIVLRVEVETVDEKEAALHFSIRDTGIGIPREKQEILFQPFEQVDGSDQRKYGGTGLGLSICKQLVALMGGHTWFKSWPGEGSVFHFIVRFKKQDVSAPPVNAPEIAPELRGTQLLLVDDNATCRSILRNQLVEWGFQVTEAESGHAAIKELEDARGTARKYSIILLDKEMPAMDGLATTRQILQNSAQNYSIVMMLPSNNISNDFASGQELGISHYLIKPVKKSELLKIVLKALGEGKNEKEPDEKAIQQHSDGYASHLNVLVAEDNATSQLIVKKILEKAGHNVQIAITGIESIRMLKEGKYDLVLMDVEMPEMSGLEATRIIRKTETGSNRHIPIIAMTAYAMKEDRQRCLDAGMDTYLSKPVNVEELHKVIRGLSSKRNNGSSIVDIDAALKFVGGDKEILKEVVRVFVQDDYPKQLRNLKDGISRHDAEAVKAAAHSIKGAVRSIGSMPTGNIALRLEEMGRNNNLTGAEAALQELEQGVTNVKEYYEQYNGPKAQ